MNKTADNELWSTETMKTTIFKDEEIIRLDTTKTRVYKSEKKIGFVSLLIRVIFDDKPTNKFSKIRRRKRGRLNNSI